MNTLEPVLDGLLDYGGCFPPTSLPLRDAMAEAARFPTELRLPNIVGNDLVVRAPDLDAITAEALLEAGWQAGRACYLSVVRVPLLASGDVAGTIAAFNQESSMGKVPRRVTQLETRLDTDLDRVSRVAAQVTPARYLLGEAGVRILIEFRWPDEAWAKGREQVMALLDALNADPELPPVGLKVRCGGPYGLQPGTLAQVLQDLSERVAPLKATQGVNRPLAEPEGNGTQVGFMGLAVAARMERVHSLGSAALEACLRERDAAAFRFDGTLSWRDHVIDKAELGASEFVPLRVGSADVFATERDVTRLWPETPVLAAQGH